MFFQHLSAGIQYGKVLNQVALALAGINEVGAGIEWLKLAIEIYPAHAALYDTAGALYLKLGQREQALASYKKALEAAPNLQHAREMLKKLAG